MAKGKLKCPAPGCDQKTFGGPSALRLHIASQHIGDDQLLALASRDAGNTAEHNNPSETSSRTEPELAATVKQGFKAIEERLGDLGGKVSDLCQQHPELCRRVESIEQAVSGRPIQYGTDEWRDARERDLAHTLFADCPECAPIRDKVLGSRGKKLADVDVARGAEAEAQDSDVAEPELEKSPGPRAGFEWDWDEGCYVRKRE